MKSALIGYTGFVGSNLALQNKFDDKFNSSNIEKIRAQRYDTIVCAGAPGFKWKANREPEADRASIQNLIDNLTHVETDHFVLLSTVDVYPQPRDVDESSPIESHQAQPYGAHRLRLEKFVEERFSSTIIRLPGLFGPNLKKNVIFDLLTNHETTKINPAGILQFYDVTRLWSDIQVVRQAGLNKINFATEPVRVSEIHSRWFSRLPLASETQPAAHYDFHTLHASAWNKSGPYMMNQSEVLAGLAQLVAQWPSLNSGV